MEVPECAYYWQTEDFITPKGTCNLLPEKHPCFTYFRDCEIIPISECPYKQYICGQIDKITLNNLVINARKAARK